MEGVTESSPASAPREASHKDELFMHRRLLFADSLKDLKNLRKQLYSAAEYFEVSYDKEDQKDLVMETMKDYAMKSFINTVDHLGSVAYKINSFLDENIGEVPGTELQITCIEQRLHTCQEFSTRNGVFQQSLVLNYPKYHKHYTFPVGETMSSLVQAQSVHHQATSSWFGEDSKRFDNEITRDTPSQLVRKRFSIFESPPHSPSGPRTFHFTSILSKKASGSAKRAASPSRFPLIRSGSLAKRSISPSPGSLAKRSVSPSTDKRRHPSAPPRSASMYVPAERDERYEIQPYTSKSNNLFRALLSMRKSTKNVPVYNTNT